MLLVSHLECLLCIAKTKPACVQNAAFHLLWMTFPSQWNILKFLILILHLLFAKTRALHSYYNAQNDIRWLYFSASNLFSSMGYYSWNIQSWCATKPLHIFHWSSSMCNYINHFILFFSGQAIIWSVWCNSFLLFFQFFIHCSRMGIFTSLITSYTTLGCFCYLLGFHLCNIFTLTVSNYYKL